MSLANKIARWLRPAPQPPRLMIAYSFPKTGTTSLHQTLGALPGASDVRSAHYLSRPALENFRQAALASTLEPQRTMMLETHDYCLETRRQLDRALATTQSSEKPLLLIGLREPVATRLSAIFYHYSASPEYLASLSDAQIIAMLRGDQPSGMPLDEIFNCSWHQQQQAWLEEDCKPVLGIDLCANEFDYEQGYTVIETDRLVLGVIRVEDLAKLPELVGKVTGMSQQEQTIARQSNSASDRPDAERYRRVRSQVSLSTEVLEEVYSTQYATHFYTEEERAKLITNWSSPA